MKVIHFSDTHLGYREYHAYDPITNVNQRELDVYNAFDEIVDNIIKIKPDLVIHAGDLFDSQRPTNRAISVAMKGMSNISKEKIPVVIIAGNHSTPRNRSEQPILEILNYFPGIHSVHHGKYKKIPIGECLIHAIPHMYSNEDLQNAIKKLNPDPTYKYNILTTHAAIRGINDISSKEFKEQTIPKSFLSKKFNYIALGHYHKFIKIQNNAYYCGSPEKFSFNEESYSNGFIDIDLDQFDLKHRSTKTRPMETITIDCKEKMSYNIMDELENKTQNIENKIIRLTYDKIKTQTYFELDQHKIKNMMASALHYEPCINIITEDNKIENISSIGDIKNEYDAYVNKQNMTKGDKNSILTLGKKYLDEAMGN